MRINATHSVSPFVLAAVGVAALCVFAGSALAGQASETTEVSPAAVKQLVQAELVLGLVLLLLLGFAAYRGKNKCAEVRGLGLPRGSVRSVLALFIVGSTINFLLFGAGIAGNNFSEVVAALGTLSASVVGFYFGGRTAASPPKPGKGSKGANRAGDPGNQQGPQ